MPIHEIKDCEGCENCYWACPADVIRMDPQTNEAKITYPYNCQVCHMCALVCPVDAITVTPDRSRPMMVSWR